jgi:hypothetical protein
MCEPTLRVIEMSSGIGVSSKAAHGDETDTGIRDIEYVFEQNEGSATNTEFHIADAYCCNGGGAESTNRFRRDRVK